LSNLNTWNKTVPTAFEFSLRTKQKYSGQECIKTSTHPVTQYNYVDTPEPKNSSIKVPKNPTTQLKLVAHPHCAPRELENTVCSSAAVADDVPAGYLILIILSIK